MRTRTAVVLLLSAALTRGVMADEAQDTARGLSMTGAAQMGDIESINLLNGSLMLHVPIAPSFQLNGGASYGIALVFTGQPWDFINPVGGRTAGRTRKTVPNRRSNAGLGCRG